MALMLLHDLGNAKAVYPFEQSLVSGCRPGKVRKIVVIIHTKVAE